MKIYSNLSLLILAGFFISCATQNIEEPLTPAKIEKEIYDQAQERIKSGNFSMAIDALESLERRFPFGKYAEQAQAELIYAYYENGLYESAVVAAERFISLHPRHPNTDYAYYMKGLAKFSKEKELLSNVPILGELTYKRDLTQAKESFDELTEFISRFPESSYVEDAKRRMYFLKVLGETDFRFELSAKNCVFQHQTKSLHFLKMLDFEVYNVRNMSKTLLKALLKHC